MNFVVLQIALLCLVVSGVLAHAQAPSYSFSTVAGTPPTQGFRDGSGREAQFNSPTGIGIDPAGNIIVGDWGNFAVRRITPAGETTTLALEGSRKRKATLGNSDRAGNFNALLPWTSSIRKFAADGTTSDVSLADAPNGVGEAVLDAAGNWFVTDTDRARVLRVDPSGRISVVAGGIGTSAGSGEQTTPGRFFRSPVGIAIDSAGILYVSDSASRVIRKVTPEGVVTAFAGISGEEGTEDGAPGIARFRWPMGIAFDPNGNLLVADDQGHSIRRISPSGEVATIAGLGGNPGGGDGIGTAARFDRPTDVVADSAGNIYVADSGNHAVRKIAADGTVTTLAGKPSRGHADGARDRALFHNPHGMAVDAAGNIYVADTGNHVVRRVAPDGTVSTIAGKAGERGSVDGNGPVARFQEPRAIAVTPSGVIYVADSHHTHWLRRIAPDGTVSTVSAGSGYSVQHFAAGPSGAIYFANFNGIYRWFEGSLTLITPNHGTIQLQACTGLAVDVHENIFVSTAADSRPAILRVSQQGVVTAVMDNGSARGTDDGTTETARLSSPGELAADANGNVFVIDGHAVRMISADGNVRTLGGLPGIAGSSDGIGPAAMFNAPSAIAVDASGTLHVLDTFNNTIRRGVPTAETAAPYVGAAPFSQNQDIGAHGSASFSVTPSGTAPFRFQWDLQGVVIPGATGPTLLIDDASVADQGTYSITVSNDAGSTMVPVGTLTVYQPIIRSFAVKHSAPGGSFLWGIAYGNGTLVAVGEGGKILTSTNGTVWTPRDSGTSEWLTAVTFAEGEFLAVGGGGTILSSADGRAWTLVPSPTTSRLNNISFAPSNNNVRYLAVGENGTIISSNDARSWKNEAVPPEVTGWLRGIAGRNQVVSGDAGVILVKFASGQPWSLNYVPGRVSLESTVSVRNPTMTAAYVSVGADGSEVTSGAYTPMSFLSGYLGSQVRPTRTTARLRGLVSGADALFATGENGTVLGAAKPGGPWSPIPSGTTANLVSGVFANNSLYVVGENETILQSELFYESRLMNISSRALVGPGEETLIGGFVVNGDRPKKILLRAVGPALSESGLENFLTDPVLTLFDASGTPIAENRGWSSNGEAAAISAASAGVGAAPFPAGSGDAAILATVPPGAYTLQVTSASGARGLALVEAFDADGPSDGGSRAINISTRAKVETGQDRVIAGFVMGGTAARKVLIRAAGPTLTGFGLHNILERPRIEVFNRFGFLVQQSGSWTNRPGFDAWSIDPNADELRAAAAAAGATPFLEGNADAALIFNAPPGPWTVHVTGADGGTGIALVEVYDLP